MRALTVLVAAVGISCTGADGDDSDGSFVGVWQYQAGSFSFVNCFTSSTTVDLTRSGFVITDETSTLVRVNPDGCRFTIVPTTARHATGVEGETCTVTTTDPYGDPISTRYEVRTLLLELDPGDGTSMIEVFAVDTEQTTTLGTVACEISGNNTLDRAP